MKLTIANVDFSAIIVNMEARIISNPSPPRLQSPLLHINAPPDAKWYHNQDLHLALMDLYGGHNGILFVEMRKILRTLGWWNTNAMSND